MTIETRLTRLEKQLDAEQSTRLGYSLEQLVEGSLGHDPGPPARVLQPGDEALEDLVHSPPLPAVK